MSSLQQKPTKKDAPWSSAAAAGGEAGDSPALANALNILQEKIEPLIQEIPVMTGDDAPHAFKSDDVGTSKVRYMQANEAVDINRMLKDEVRGFLPPMNWWDMLPDWPAISYAAIIADQTRAAKEAVLRDIDPPDEVELEIASHKFPYKEVGVASLQKGMVNSSDRSIVVGHELRVVDPKDKDTVNENLRDIEEEDVSVGVVTNTTQVNSDYHPLEPMPFIGFPNVYRDDLTDQKNPVLDLVDTQRLVDEFLDLGKRIYDSQTNNPTIFGFDHVVSRYEKDKNIVLANYKQYKVNVRKMEHLNNIVEKNSNNYLIKNITYRHDIPDCSMTEEFTTRYLREKLLAWYNQTADPQTLIWTHHHWLPGEPGQIEELLTVGNYQWYDNLAAGLEDSLARLEDLEATLDLLASMANVKRTIDKYKTAVELAERAIEQTRRLPQADGSTITSDPSMIFTDEVIDATMLRALLNVSEVVASANGEVTALRKDLEQLRLNNQAILQETRKMPAVVLSTPAVIYEKLFTLCDQVNMDIATYLNTLILDLRGDFETEGKHSSPSHLLLDISQQLTKICNTVVLDVENIIQQQMALPTMGKHRLDSMVNKINEIRMYGPVCSIPWHYWMAIDNVNAAERLYNDIWSDVFDCWEREYITRVWRIVKEHHDGGVIPSSLYGKPLFSAECPHHLPQLEAPVPVDYRDIDIKYLSANCRKNFNFLTSWLTSALYAIGVKRAALGAVINDTSLNGDDQNEKWLDMLNELNAKNLVIKNELDKVIGVYSGSGLLLQKADLDQIVAAKELSPTLYSNQTLLNMSSQLQLLNTDPVTELEVATNENRTGTEVSDSPALKWEKYIIPANLEPEKKKELQDKQDQVSKIDQEARAAQVDVKKAERAVKAAEKALAEAETKLARTAAQIKLAAAKLTLAAAQEKADQTEEKRSDAQAELAEILLPFKETEILQVSDVSTVGGDAEVVVHLPPDDADQDTSSSGHWVGDVDEFKPWHYMQPVWETQGTVKDIPAVVPPTTTPVVPDPTVVENSQIEPKPEDPVKEIKLDNNPVEPWETHAAVAKEAGGTDPGVRSKIQMVDALMKSLSTGMNNRTFDQTKDKHEY